MNCSLHAFTVVCQKYSGEQLAKSYLTVKNKIISTVVLIGPMCFGSARKCATSLCGVWTSIDAQKNERIEADERAYLK